MTTAISQTPRRVLATAGLLYLGIIGLGISSEAVLRGSLIDWEDADATTWAMATGMGRFRLSIGFDLVMAAFDVALAVVLFNLLRGVDEMRALLAMVFRLMQAAVIAGSLLFLLAAIQAVETGAAPLPWLRMHATGYDLGLAFFGLNSLIMAGLLCRWGAPPLIAAGIGAAGLVYLAGSFTRFLAPEWNVAMQPAYLIPVVAETALMAWLLYRAIRPFQQRQKIGHVIG